MDLSLIHLIGTVNFTFKLTKSKGAAPVVDQKCTDRAGKTDKTKLSNLEMDAINNNPTSSPKKSILSFNVKRNSKGGVTVTRTVTNAESGPSSSCSSTRPKLVLFPHQRSVVTEAEEEEEETIEVIDIDSSSSSSSPCPVRAASAGSHSEIVILSSDEEELQKKRTADDKVKTHKAKQPLSSKRLDIKSLSSKNKLSKTLSSKNKLSVPKPLPRLIKDRGKGSSDGLSPIATYSPSWARREKEIVSPFFAEASDFRNGLKKKVVGETEPEFSSLCVNSLDRELCYDPLERDPDETVVRDDEAEAPREALTAKKVKESALQNAEIDHEYSVKNKLQRLKAVSSTVNSENNNDEDDWVQIVEKEICEIVLESSDEEEDEGKVANTDDDNDDEDDIQVIENPNIQSLEKTQQKKVAEQLSSAGELCVPATWPR